MQTSRPVFFFSCHQAHYVRAKALCCAGRREEALQEYFICVALKPDWTSVKAEAQKVTLHPLYHFQRQCLINRRDVMPLKA